MLLTLAFHLLVQAGTSSQQPTFVQDSTPGFAFGKAGTSTTQGRFLIETGIVF